MARFMGTVQGGRGLTSRCGHIGMETYCASWAGAVRCKAYVNDDGTDCVRVELTPWEGAGTYRLLYDGPINGEGN